LNKKILHLITSLEGGGTENFLYQILSASPSGFEHQVVFLKKDGVIGERIRRLGLPVIASGGPMSLTTLFEEFRPDILHTCLYSAHILGRCFGKMAHIPAIITSQRAIDIWQKPWQTLIDRWTLPLSDAVIVNSQAAGDVIRKRRGQRERPEIFTISNGIDLQRFQKGDRAAARSRYGLPADAIVGGTLMRLHREKGADFIPDFAQNLLQQQPRLHLLVGGVGPLADEIGGALKKSSHGSRVHLIGWEDDTPAFLSALDFFWSLSREESFPQTLVEASAMGLPWIAPDTGGVSQLIAQGAAGRTYPRLDLVAAVAKTAELTADLAGSYARAAQASEKIKNAYVLSKMITAVYDVFGRF